VILVDSSVWVGHLRRADPALMDLLEEGMVAIHPLVIGELACGNIPQRAEVLSLLQQLPAIPTATDQEALTFIDRHHLMGRGIGYIDVHLLASTLLTDDARLWTADARLSSAASRLFVAYERAGR
jgi:predicted nucleic acid-binding protein